METSAVRSVKLAIVAITGLSKDALHVYIGLTVFLLVAAVNKRTASSRVPWLAVLLTATLGALVDMRDDIRSLGCG